MFRFKQFTINQERCPMKVGTDGVLLGAWVGLHPTDRYILDIGTGTGVIALMMAQRTSESRIVGVDIDDVTEARENAAISPWPMRLSFEQCPIQEFVSSHLFDLIVSNPPFFVDSLISPDAGRTTARHAVSLTFEDLCSAVMRLLAPEGRFAVVLPITEAERFLNVSNGRLALVRRTKVRTTPRRAPKRVLLEFMQADSFGAKLPLTSSELVIGTGSHEEYTPEYRALTRDFYLKF